MIASAANRDRQQPGFTLIEILIAVSVFAIVLAAINTIYYGAVRLRNKTQTQLEQSLLIEQAVNLMKRDLANLVAPGGTMSGALTTGQSLTSQSSMSAASDTEFYTASAQTDADSPWSEIQKVSYYLVPPTNQSPGMDLMRSVSRNLLPVINEDVDEQWVLSGLDKLTFEYYDGALQEWTDTWDSTSTEEGLPRAIRVIMDFAAKEEGEEAPPSIEFIVMVSVQGKALDYSITAESPDAGGGGGGGGGAPGGASPGGAAQNPTGGSNPRPGGRP